MKFVNTLRNGFFSLCLAAVVLLLTANRRYFLFCEPADHEEHFFHPDNMVKANRKLLAANNRSASPAEDCIPLFSRKSKPRLAFVETAKSDLASSRHDKVTAPLQSMDRTFIKEIAISTKSTTAGEPKIITSDVTNVGKEAPLILANGKANTTSQHTTSPTNKNKQDKIKEEATVKEDTVSISSFSPIKSLVDRSAMDKVVKTTGKLLDSSQHVLDANKLADSSLTTITKPASSTIKQEMQTEVTTSDAKHGAEAPTLTTPTITKIPGKMTDSSINGLDQSTTKHDKPLNILLLYPDDWRHDTIGVAGTQPVITPFLDSFAKEGVRFTHNCVTTSICWISRATLATGQYLARHKSESVKNPVFYKYWNETWQGLLRDNGYYTGHIGKWQYRNYSFVSDNHDYTSLYEGTHWVQKRGEAKIAATDACRNDSISFLRNRPKDRPFALTVAFYPPKAIGSAAEQWFPKKETRMLYDNITVPEPKDWNASYYKLPEFFRIKNEARNRWNQRFSTFEKYQNSMKNYYALITQVDEACKDIVDEIKAQGLLDDTLIIFTTDNGFFHGEHGLAGKWFPYQESIRVPLIIRDPRMPKSKIGTVDDSFTLNIDLAPTIIEAAKLPIPERMQGKDMSDLYLSPEAKQSWRQEFYYEHPSLGSKYIPPSSALVRKDFKFMYYQLVRIEQLFNLATDPLESEDLSNRTEHAALMKEMRKRHNEYREQVK